MIYFQNHKTTTAERKKKIGKTIIPEDFCPSHSKTEDQSDKK